MCIYFLEFFLLEYFGMRSSAIDFFAHFQILIHGIVEVKRFVFFVSMQRAGGMRWHDDHQCKRNRWYNFVMMLSAIF